MKTQREGLQPIQEIDAEHLIHPLKNPDLVVPKQDTQGHRRPKHEECQPHRLPRNLSTHFRGQGLYVDD